MRKIKLYYGKEILTPVSYRIDNNSFSPGGVCYFNFHNRWGYNDFIRVCKKVIVNCVTPYNLNHRAVSNFFRTRIFYSDLIQIFCD